jgi:hypothetical protein
MRSRVQQEPDVLDFIEADLDEVVAGAQGGSIILLIGFQWLWDDVDGNSAGQLADLVVLAQDHASSILLRFIVRTEAINCSVRSSSTTRVNIGYWLWPIGALILNRPEPARVGGLKVEAELSRQGARRNVMRSAEG